MRGGCARSLPEEETWTHKGRQGRVSTEERSGHDTERGTICKPMTETSGETKPAVWLDLEPLASRAVRK